MMLNSINMQNYWFPGHADQRSIFDFTNNVLNIESPGFPLVPVDSDNFGNVITLDNGIGYYIIGKYLMDANFSVVSGSSGIFDNLSSSIACTGFAPDLANTKAAHLYFIDSDGLHYGHISTNLFKESTLESLALVPLTYAPVQNSPLCIIGDSVGGGNWLIYVTLENNLHKIVAAYCDTNTEMACSLSLLPIQNNPISIDFCKNRISLVFDNNSLIYGTLAAADKKLTIDIEGMITGVSVDCVQSAFSATANFLFWLSKSSNKCYLNYMNMISGDVTTVATTGVYKALKRGIDNIIYGLNHQTSGSSTLLLASPNGLTESFAISEIITQANGGYFPAAGWEAY